MPLVLYLLFVLLTTNSVRSGQPALQCAQLTGIGFSDHDSRASREGSEVAWGPVKLMFFLETADRPIVLGSVAKFAGLDGRTTERVKTVTGVGG